MLEDENIIESHLGSKSFIKFSEDKLHNIRNELIESEMIKTLSSLKNMGLNKDEYISFVDKYWNEV